jgi:hypothetical protein
MSKPNDTPGPMKDGHKVGVGPAVEREFVLL